VHLIDVVRIDDGSRVTIRPSLPQDVELQRAFFRSLSAEGRYCRFMTRLNEPPEALIERFACIDYRSHLALLAEVFEDGQETMIGEARYIVDVRAPEACEFAVAVADDCNPMASPEPCSTDWSAKLPLQASGAWSLIHLSLLKNVFDVGIGGG
jgi:hypothetical protein